jgi:hypothetical protein
VQARHDERDVARVRAREADGARRRRARVVVVRRDARHGARDVARRDGECGARQRISRATRRDSATRDARERRDDMRATRAGIYL